MFLLSLIYLNFICNVIGLKYSNPTNACPLQSINSKDSCKIIIFNNISLTSYTQVEVKTLNNLNKCKSNISNNNNKIAKKIEITLNGCIQGRQFDRYGGIFLDNIEIIRLTTPEPMHVNYSQCWNFTTGNLCVNSSPGTLHSSLMNFLNVPKNHGLTSQQTFIVYTRLLSSAQIYLNIQIIFKVVMYYIKYQFQYLILLIIYILVY